jgi:hypothetical protein
MVAFQDPRENEYPPVEILFDDYQGGDLMDAATFQAMTESWRAKEEK